MKLLVETRSFLVAPWKMLATARPRLVTAMTQIFRLQEGVIFLALPLILVCCSSSLVERHSVE